MVVTSVGVIVLMVVLGVINTVLSVIAQLSWPSLLLVLPNLYISSNDQNGDLGLDILARAQEKY